MSTTEASVTGARLKVTEFVRVENGKIVALRSVVLADGREVTF